MDWAGALVAGRLTERSFGDIWWESDLLRSLRSPTLNDRCGACEYHELCGGCRARALASSGDPFGEDPWCTYTPGTDEPTQPREEPSIAWTAEAELQVKKVPFFVRRVVRAAVERFAHARGEPFIAPELLHEARWTLRRP